MSRARLACVLTLIGWSALCFAHTHLVKTLPANDSTLTAAPTNFVLTFAEPVKLTALALQRDSEPAKRIGPLPAASAAEVSVPAPPLKTGKYVLSWRAVSDDGHVMPGKVVFTVRGP